MNLRETVSEMLQRPVSEEEARQFAQDQFGVLSTYLRTAKVVVNVKGGIANVERLPDHITVEIRDYDVQDTNQTIYADTFGDEYTKSITKH